MAEVLVLVDHTGGQVRKTTSELLTLARRLGEPSAVFVGDGYDEAKATLGAYGAQKVYRADSADLVDYLVVPQAELLAQLVEKTSPAAVLIASSAEGSPRRRAMVSSSDVVLRTWPPALSTRRNTSAMVCESPCQQT